MKTFEYDITVTKNDLDALKHVNNVVYVQWIQDISTKHWKDLTKNTPDLNYVWVVTRHEIDYKGQALLNEIRTNKDITFKTWVGITSGVTSVRHVEIFKENKLIVKAQTTWCMLHAKTLKPARITESVLKVLDASK